MQWPWILLLLAVGFMLYIAMRKGMSSEPLPEGPNRLIIDARSSGEFQSGHVPGAVHIPHTDVTRMAKTIGDKNRAVIVYCASGMRSSSAVQRLKQMGYIGVVNGGGVYSVAQRLGVTLVR